MNAHDVLALITFAVAFLANPAHAQVPSSEALPKKTICFATINSDDEKLTFQKYLHPDHFNFVELVKNSSDVNFLNRACRNTKLKCDVTLFSAHFGGGFTDNKEFFLPLEDVQKVSCGGCPNVLGADTVYLFGCNTLAGKTNDGRTPQEYYQVLIDEVGLEPAEARATVAVRYSAIGNSFNDVIRRIFKGAAVVGGFTSKAPLGEQIRPSLAGYFGTSVTGLKMDGVLEEWEQKNISLAFYNELNRMKAGASTGENKATADMGQRIQKKFGGIIGNGYVDVPGIQTGSTEDFVANRMCSMNNSKEKLKIIADIVNTGDRAFVIQMLPYLIEISDRGNRMNDEQEAFFASLSGNSHLKDLISGPRGIIGSLAQAPEEQLKTVDLAFNLRWLSDQEKTELYQKAARYVWNNAISFIDNKKFLSKISAQLMNVTSSQIEDDAFKGRGIFVMIQKLKSNQADWAKLMTDKLGIAAQYYFHKYEVSSSELANNRDLSEGWIEKHKGKIKDARKSSEEICSIIKKNGFTKASAATALAPFRSQFEAMGAKGCL